MKGSVVNSAQSLWLLAPWHKVQRAARHQMPPVTRHCKSPLLAGLAVMARLLGHPCPARLVCCKLHAATRLVAIQLAQRKDPKAWVNQRCRTDERLFSREYWHSVSGSTGAERPGSTTYWVGIGSETVLKAVYLGLQIVEFWVQSITRISHSDILEFLGRSELRCRGYSTDLLGFKRLESPLLLGHGCTTV